MAKTPIEIKIAALLAQAESTPYPAEAEAFSEAAAKLMLRYGIEQAALDAARTGLDKRDTIREERLVFIGSHAKQWSRFVSALANGYGSLQILLSEGRDWEGTGKEKMTVYVIGYDSDLTQFLTLQASLQLQAISAQKKWWKTFPGKQYMTAGEKWRDRAEFVKNFSYAAAHKMAAARRTAVQEAGAGTEIMLQDRSKSVQEWLDAHHNYTAGKVSRAQGGSLSAASAGRAAGSNAATGGSSITGRAAIGAGAR